MNARCTECGVSLEARGDIDGDLVCDTCDGKGKKKTKKVIKKIVKKTSYSPLFRFGFLLLFGSALLGFVLFIATITGLQSGLEAQAPIPFLKVLFFSASAGMFMVSIDSQLTGIAGTAFDRMNRILSLAAAASKTSIFEVEIEDKKGQFYIVNAFEFLFSFALLTFGTIF